jgi:hypothetical protein
MKITHLELNPIGHSQTTTRTFREKGSYIRMWFLFCFQVWSSNHTYECGFCFASEYGVLTSDSFEVEQATKISTHPTYYCKYSCLL